jgi:hypothetical protein
LVCLFQELLDVDRHRKAFSKNGVNQEKAGVFEAQARLRGVPLSVLQLATLVNVSPATIVSWKLSESYEEGVQSEMRHWREILAHYYARIRADYPEMSEEETFERAFELYGQDFPERMIGS